MKKLLFPLFVTLFISCSSCNTFLDMFKPVIEQAQEQKKEEPQTHKEKVIDTLGDYLVYGATVGLLGALLCLIASFKIPPFIHAAYLLGLTGGSCLVSIYALDYIWLIAGTVFFMVVAWGVYHLYMKAQEIKEHKEIQEELATHFDDPNGENNLSEKAKNIQLIHRHKGKDKEGK